MSADSQTLQAKYQKLAAEFAKVGTQGWCVLPHMRKHKFYGLIKISLISVDIIKILICLFVSNIAKAIISSRILLILFCCEVI